VIWDFVGEPIPPAMLEELAALGRELSTGELAPRLASLLSPPEVSAIGRRVDELLAGGRFPEPGPGRPYPWPVV
jgi:hypothetical protein